MALLRIKLDLNDEHHILQVSGHDVSLGAPLGTTFQSLIILGAYRTFEIESYSQLRSSLVSFYRRS